MEGYAASMYALASDGRSTNLPSPGWTHTPIAVEFDMLPIFVVVVNLVSWPPDGRIAYSKD